MIQATQVVVVGGGFGGINLVKQLAKDPSFQITLIDKMNHHLFQPLLYQVATAGLSPADIAVPIRSIFSQFSNVEVILDEIRDVDRVCKRVRSATAEYKYDFLVLACGARDSYFGHEEWAAAAPGLKSLTQATEIRARILFAFEEAEKEKNPEHLRRWLTFVIVGGGPTGVELAGAIAELSRVTLSQDFRHINPSLARIVLIEGGPRILPSFAPKLSERARCDLESMGVEVWSDSRVTLINAEGIQVGEKSLSARTTFWAAGVRASSLAGSESLRSDNSDRQGRLAVDESLRLKIDHSIFVIGDMSLHLQKGKPLPGVAAVAMQQGRYVAKYLKNRARGRNSKSFVYVDKGSLATIGRNRAVLERGKFKLGGRIAWILWLGIHVFYLIGFQNRVAVLLQWAWAYFTYRRGARLITSERSDTSSNMEEVKRSFD